MPLEPDKILKGIISETIVELMFRELGFYVIHLGKEHTLNPLTQLKDFIEKCKGKFTPQNSDVSDKIRKFPDFVIINKDGEVCFLEVKYRCNAKLWEDDLTVLNDNMFPKTFLVVANSFVSETIYPKNVILDSKNIKNEEERNELQKEYMKNRFHVWVNAGAWGLVDEKERSVDVKGHIQVFPMNEFLSEKFDLENVDSIIEKYEKLVTKWIPLNESPLKNEPNHQHKNRWLRA